MPSAPLLGLSRSSVFIPELESVRGIAVLLVVAFHVDGYARLGLPAEQVSLPLAFVRAGHTGVDLFFLLSGFLLSLPFLADLAGDRRVRVREYFARRALRILPLYWLAVAIGTVCTAGRAADLLRGLPCLVFLNALPAFSPPLYPYSAVWWSLGTEVQFYVLLPLLLLGRTRRGRIGLVLLLVAYVLAYGALVRGHIHAGSILGQMALNNSIVGRGPLFLCGIAAAYLYRRWGPRLRERLAASPWLRTGGADALLLGALVALATLLRWLVAIGAIRQQGIFEQPWHVVNGALWTAVLLLLLLAPLRSRPLFSNRVLARLGVLSYSIYLIHVPLFGVPLIALRNAFPTTFVRWDVPSTIAIAVLVLVCLALSSLTYRFVECPFLARKARFDS